MDKARDHSIDELRLDLMRSMHNAGLYPDHDDAAAQLLGELLYKAGQYGDKRELDGRIDELGHLADNEAIWLRNPEQYREKGHSPCIEVHERRAELKKQRSIA